MSAFDIPKNLVALLGALALAALFATAQPAEAGETAPTDETAEVATDTVAHHIDLNTLRKMLSTPHLNFEERHQLQRELNEIEEESA